MRLVTYNIQYGRGRDKCFDLARTAATVAGADIICLQEVERHWQRSGEADQPAEIAARFPDHHWIYGAPFDMDASYRDSQGKLVNRRRQFGNMVLSRWPIVSSRLHLLPKFATTTQFNSQSGALEAVIAAPAGPLRIYCVHLGYMIPAERMAQIAALRAIVHRAPDEGGPWTGGGPASDRDAEERRFWQCDGGAPPMPRESILMGDFNLEPDYPEYEELVGPYDKDYGRIDVTDRWVDAWVAGGQAPEAGVTFGFADYSDWRHCRLDYVFLSSGLATALRSCRIDENAEASDHQPVWIELDD